MSEASYIDGPKDWITPDHFIRVLVVSWFFIVETFLAFGFNVAARATSLDDAVGLTRLLAHACLMLFVAMMVLLTIVRGKPEVKAPGLQPRIAAILGTNLIMFGAFFLPAGPRLGMFGSLASAGLILGGQFLAVVVIRHLGRSFSIMAEARTLVTDGPYAIVRHPLYLVEQIATVGVFIQVASWPAAVLFAVQFAFQLWRMRNEEAVLQRAFPRDYSVYATKTARLLPGIW